MSCLSPERHGPAQKCSAERDDATKAKGPRVWWEPLGEDETTTTIRDRPKGGGKLIQRIGSSRDRHCWNRRIGTGVRLTRRRIGDSEPGGDSVNDAMRRIEADEKIVVALRDVLKENVERIICRRY